MPIARSSAQRGGRLPLPTRAVDLTRRETVALARANAFLDRVAELPLEAWLQIGRAVSAADAVEGRVAAWQAIDRAIVEHELQVAAWHVRDAVDTLAFLTQSSGGRSRRDRLVLAAAHGATEDAALAILISDHAPREHVERLCAPFAPLAAPTPVRGV